MFKQLAHGGGVLDFHQAFQVDARLTPAADARAQVLVLLRAGGSSRGCFLPCPCTPLASPPRWPRGGAITACTSLTPRKFRRSSSAARRDGSLDDHREHVVAQGQRQDLVDRRHRLGHDLQGLGLRA